MIYYLIEKQRSNEGSILFWKSNSQGYTSNIDNAGLYDWDFVKDNYLGQCEETFAIEKDKFEKIMKTIKIVCNYSDFYMLMHEMKNEEVEE